MLNFGLSNLLAPLPQSEFFQLYWPHSPLFLSTSSNKFKEIFELPQLQSLESLIAARSLKVRACLPDFDDEYSSIHLDPKDALKAYRNNMTLVFDSMQTQDSIIASTLDNIRRDLGLVTGGAENDLCKARSIVYATPAGAGTRLHFDANVNFIIQLHGSKRWALAPNHSVTNPTERFTAGASEISGALEKQCHAPLIYQLPEDSREFVMEPGCVLFVPRGYWHETSTDEDSLSLNFTFSQPTWADILTKSLHVLLLNSLKWRELADGLESSDPVRSAQAITHFELLLKQLGAEFSEISGRQLLLESSLIPLK